MKFISFSWLRLNSPVRTRNRFLRLLPILISHRLKYHLSPARFSTVILCASALRTVVSQQRLLLFLIRSFPQDVRLLSLTLRESTETHLLTMRSQSLRSVLILQFHPVRSQWSSGRNSLRQRTAARAQYSPRLSLHSVT